MTTREQVTWLWFNGCSNIRITERLGITRQRVSQILATPPTWKATKPGRKPAPSLLLAYKPEPRHHFRSHQLPQVKAILRRRDSWTWVEAEVELLKNNLKHQAGQIYEFLRDVGFKWNPSRKRWVKE